MIKLICLFVDRIIVIIQINDNDVIRNWNRQHEFHAYDVDFLALPLHWRFYSSAISLFLVASIYIEVSSGCIPVIKLHILQTNIARFYPWSSIMDSTVLSTNTWCSWFCQWLAEVRYGVDSYPFGVFCCVNWKFSGREEQRGILHSDMKVGTMLSILHYGRIVNVMTLETLGSNTA